MDFSLSVFECDDGSGYIWSPSGGVMQNFETYQNALAVWNLMGDGAV
jgi:hypothetical protein